MRLRSVLLGLLLALMPLTAKADNPISIGVTFVTGYSIYGYTASGTYTHDGTAACPPEYAFGTKIHLEGKGMVLDVVCEDLYDYRTLSRRFDIWVPRTRMAYALTGDWVYFVVTDRDPTPEIDGESF